MTIDERAFIQNLADLVMLGVEAERERCAQIAEARALELRAKAKEQKSPGSRQSYFAQSIEARVIADAIRAAVSEAGGKDNVVILALDGAWRSGAWPDQIIAALEAKQAKNEAHQWPDWRTADPNKAIEHVKALPSKEDRK